MSHVPQSSIFCPTLAINEQEQQHEQNVPPQLVSNLQSGARIHRFPTLQLTVAVQSLKLTGPQQLARESREYRDRAAYIPRMDSGPNSSSGTLNRVSKRSKYLPPTKTLRRRDSSDFAVPANSSVTRVCCSCLQANVHTCVRVLRVCVCVCVYVCV
jgi:hypothetical protein